MTRQAVSPSDGCPAEIKSLGCRVMGATDSETGKPVESKYLSSHIEFGRQSPYNALIPFEFKTLQDVVDHYQDLVELFDSWQSESKPGKEPSKTVRSYTSTSWMLPSDLLQDRAALHSLVELTQIVLAQLVHANALFFCSRAALNQSLA